VDAASHPRPASGVLALSQSRLTPATYACDDAIRNMALWLDGWDDRSIWGYDPQADGFFAHLWRNDEPDTIDDAPHIWITPRFSGDLATPDEVARQVALRTHRDLAEVCAAMNESAPPYLRLDAS
jgi:hypothetical protein